MGPAAGKLVTVLYPASSSLLGKEKWKQVLLKVKPLLVIADAWGSLTRTGPGEVGVLGTRFSSHLFFSPICSSMNHLLLCVWFSPLPLAPGKSF